MMVRLTDCAANFTSMGIDVDAKGGWDTLRDRLNSMVPLVSSMYDSITDILAIEVEDGAVLPDLSAFGTVIVNDTATQG
jgi:hypothetical protein